MAEPDAGIELTLLGSIESVSEEQFPALYAYPDSLEKCWVRSNFVASMDGGASADGKSAGLASLGDRTLFLMMRELADVVLAGAGTVRIENYGGVQLNAAARQARQARGQAEVPPIGIISQSGRLERDMKVFTHTEVPPLVLTCTAAAEATHDALGDTAVVLDCSGADSGAVDIAVVLQTLAQRGLLRVLTEGGPRLHGTFIDADLLDELCLTLAPVLVGGAAPPIATGIGAVHTKMRRAHLLADDAGFLYTRYVREA
jgi:riboflavin biosynthesis pyrimidine reductase